MWNEKALVGTDTRPPNAFEVIQGRLGHIRPAVKEPHKRHVGNTVGLE